MASEVGHSLLELHRQGAKSGKLSTVLNLSHGFSYKFEAKITQQRGSKH